MTLVNRVLPIFTLKKCLHKIVDFFHTNQNQIIEIKRRKLARWCNAISVGREKGNAACRANNLTMNTDFIHQLRRLLSQTNKLWKAYQLQLLTSSSKSRRGMGWGCIFIGFLGQLAIYIIHSSLYKVGNPNFGNKKCQSKKGGNYFCLSVRL